MGRVVRERAGDPGVWCVVCGVWCVVCGGGGGGGGGVRCVVVEVREVRCDVRWEREGMHPHLHGFGAGPACT